MTIPIESKTRLDLDQQRREVALLRQQVYWLPDPTQSPELLEQLLAAEKELHCLELVLEDGEKITSQGVLLDTGTPESQKMGAISEWTVKLEQRQSHIPTGIVHLFNSNEQPLVSAQIHFYGNELARLRVSCWVEGFSDLVVETTELTLYQKSIEIKLLPVFRAHAIRQINELTQATLHFQILDAKKNRELYRTFPIWLLPQTCVYLWIRDPVNGKKIDLTPYLAAWVTPNDNDVMQMLRAAADEHPRRALFGYQTDTDGVAEQVEAIFKALKKAGICYVNSVLAPGAIEGVFQQRVRLPRQSLATRSANCLDGTLLMASLLEAASLNPGIVLIPGHAFLAWETQRGTDEWDYLETTMNSSYDFSQAQRSGRKLAEEWRPVVGETRDNWKFRRLSLQELRIKQSITPIA